MAIDIDCPKVTVLQKRRYWADYIMNIDWRRRRRSGANISGPHPSWLPGIILRLLDKIESSTDPMLDIHTILDNYGTHKHPLVKQWF